MNNKHLFINSVSAIDAKSLENILVKNAFRKFANVSFIEKLNEIFKELKASGNTQLDVHKGVGACGCNNKRKVFCFVGNNTKDFFTLAYDEDEHNYYNFYKSCDVVNYETSPDLNKFYYFSIKLEDTTEYKNHQDASEPLREYKELSSKDICNMKEIETWLEKYKILYNNTVEVIEGNINSPKLNSVELLVNKEFENLYGTLNILSILYKKEIYFKKQLEDYNKVKDSVSKLKTWFDYQHKNKGEYKLFSSVFYDNRELTHYRFEINDLKLNPQDFKYTLGFMKIIEDSQAIEFDGVVKVISELEVFEKSKTRRSFKKQSIVLSIDDFCCSKYKVTFSEARVKHLENLNLGDFVKVRARLTGGEWEKTEGVKEHVHGLFGWSLEKLQPKPAPKENTEEVDLYYKYMLLRPF
ncbi:MAG TPA: DUF3127 domain-containing protein [Xanthomarina sp.]|nr:DUF3127 domain-containing protein [Xanthomarina sp.]